MLPGLCEASSQKGWHHCVRGCPGHRPGLCEGEKKPLMPGCRADLPRGRRGGGRVFKANINLSCKMRCWATAENAKAYLQQLVSSSALPAQHPPLSPNPSCTQNTLTHLPTCEQHPAITKKLSRAPSQSMLTPNLEGGWGVLSLFQRRKTEASSSQTPRAGRGQSPTGPLALLPQPGLLSIHCVETDGLTIRYPIKKAL